MMQHYSIPAAADRSEQSSLCPELELIFCCSRTRLSLAEEERIQCLVQQSLDWEYLLETAEYHGVLPFLSWQLQQRQELMIPGSIRNQLQEKFNQNLQHNLRLTMELLKLVKDLEAQNISVLAFKGPVLAQTAYGNLALRQFVDLDILIPDTEVTNVSQFLIAQGYQPQFTLTHLQQEIYARLRNEHSFWHDAKQLCVDLHWSIFPQYYSFSPTAQQVWQTVDRVSFTDDRTVSTLSAENLLLFLCAHGAKHDWSRLTWICDIAELLRERHALDWNYIQRSNGQFGTKRMLLIGLYLAHRWFAAPLPQCMIQRLQADPELPKLANHIQQNIVQQSIVQQNIAQPNHRPTSPFAGNPIYLRTMERWHDRLWYWVDLIATPTPLEWQLIRLPRLLFPLYSLIRILRLLLKHGLTVFQARGKSGKQDLAN